MPPNRSFCTLYHPPISSSLSLSLFSSEAYGRISSNHRIRDPDPEAGQNETQAALWLVVRQFYRRRKESVRVLAPVYWLRNCHLLLLVQLLNGGGCVGLIGESHKPKSAGPVSLSVAHHDLSRVSITYGFLLCPYIPHRQLHQWWKRQPGATLHWSPKRDFFSLNKIRKNIIY